MSTQKIILIIFGIAVISGIGFIALKPNQTMEVVNTENFSSQLCFYKEFTTSRGFKDVTSMKMSIDMDMISGEVKILPAEKDSKVGTFEGLLVETNSGTRERTALLWWDSRAEGMQVKEELLIKMNKEEDGSIDSAKIGFGEMMDRGDGVYVYKDKNNLSFIDVLGVDCATFDGRFVTENSPVPPALPTPPVAPGACFIGGCSSQICSDQEGVISTCEYREEYACYRTATCERQTSGQCGWTPTPALLACLSNS